MAGSRIRLYGATSGYVELAAPAVSPDGVLTLPTGTGGFGKTLQVVQTVKADTFSTTSAGYVDITGFSLTITPTSASNSILLMVSAAWSSNLAESNTHGITLRDGSDNNLIVPDSPGSRLSGIVKEFVSVTAANMSHASFTLLHSPATTSAFTYKVTAINGSGVTFYLNRSGTDSDNTGYIRSVSTLTAIEVAA